ncbi:hypothetical protein ACHAXH_008732 [Discostella pseudostelligera]
MTFRGTVSVILILLSPHIIASTQQACNQPAATCNQGIWSSAKCKCHCISPLCLDDASGECVASSSPTRCNDHDNNGGNPWQGCQVGIDCPWWNDITFPGRCITGSQLSSGGGTIYYATNEDCCAAHHSNNAISCITRSLIDTSNSTTAQYNITISLDEEEEEEDDDDVYSSVTIKFTVNGLPNEVDYGILETEMLFMMKKVLIDLSDLKVSKVEENPFLASESLTTAKKGTDDSFMTISIYYDVTMINYPAEDFGQFIISGFRDMFTAISQDIEECDGLVYFRFGISVNWCIDEFGEGGEFGVCVATHPKVTVGFRLANIPVKLNADELIQQVIGIYEQVLAPVEDLNILSIETKKVVDHPASNNTITKDVYVEIVDQKFVIVANETMDDPVLGPIVDERIQSSKYEILRLIQPNSKDSLDSNEYWCINGNGAYTICKERPTPKPTEPPEPPEPYPFLLPKWAIITLTVVSVAVTCCLCWCTYSFIDQCDTKKNERNMVNYLTTGQQYSKPKKEPIRSSRPPPPTYLPRRNSRPTPQPVGHQRYHESRPDVEPAVPLANDTKYLEDMPSFVFRYDNEAPPIRTADTKYLEDMHSFVFDDCGGQAPPRHHSITANETKYLENAPSFIFDSGESQSQNRLAITNGEGHARSKRDP